MSTSLSKLPPETAELWRHCANEPLLAHSYLLGGTALSLQIQHRVSEDLDFFFPAAKLPRPKIAAFIAGLKAGGKRLEQQIHWPTYDEFQLAGENLHEHHQTWLVNEKTKMSFTTLHAETARLLHTPASEHGPVIPTLGELFDTKAVLVSQRLKTRDWLDLYILMREHKFAAADFVAAYDKAGFSRRGEEELEKLTQITSPKGDEGYHSLVTPAPSVDDMRDFFKHACSEYKELSYNATPRIRP